MKNIILGIMIFASFIQSCKEYLPEHTVVKTTLDTTYINPQSLTIQPRIVLIEEFTGVSCINCPKGHEVIKSLSTTYGNKLSIVGLHQSVLAQPVNNTDEDLRTPESSSIAAEFSVSSMPVALIDRTEFNGEITLSRSDWPNAVSEEVNVPASLNLEIKTEPIQSNSCKFKYKIEFPKEYSNDVSYYICLVENGIYVTQKDGSIDIEHYKQDHVLRKMYTPANGTTLTKVGSKFEKGRTFEKEIQLDLSTKWKFGNCEIIFYVADNVTKKVLQSKTIPLQ